MIDGETILCLPLMDHLVEHGVLDFSPGMPLDVTPAQGDLGGLSRPAVDGQLTQAPLHSAGEPNRYFGQQATEVTVVQFAVQRFELVEQAHIARPGPLGSSRPWSGRRILLGGKFEELPFSQPPERPRNARIEEPDHGREHSIRRKRVAPVDPQHPPAQAQHHSLIGVGEYTLDILQTQRRQPFRQTVLNEKTLPRVPAYPLTRPHNP